MMKKRRRRRSEKEKKGPEAKRWIGKMGRIGKIG